MWFMKELRKSAEAGVWQTNVARTLGLYLNLKLWDLLLELSHSSNVISFPQPHCHHLLLTLQKNKRGKRRYFNNSSTKALGVPCIKTCTALHVCIFYLCMCDSCRGKFLIDGSELELRCYREQFNRNLGADLSEWNTVTDNRTNRSLLLVLDSDLINVSCFMFVILDYATTEL